MRLLVSMATTVCRTLATRAFWLRFLHGIESSVAASLWVGTAAVSVLFLLILVDVTGRFFFNHPLEGAWEFGEIAMSAMAFIAIGYAQLTEGHVRTDNLVSRFPPRSQNAVNIAILLLLIGFFITMTAQIGREFYTDLVHKTLRQYTSYELLIPVWPITFLAFAGCLIMDIALVTQLVRNIAGLATGKVVGFRTWTRQ